MKWLKSIIIVVLSVLLTGVFALNHQRVEVFDVTASAIDPSGNLYLLSEPAQLMKFSPEGTRVWAVSLPETTDEGTFFRYSGLISDRSGSLYLITQIYERLVDASDVVQEVILSEEIQVWNGEGAQQDTVFSVDKTTLSQQSKQNYIRTIRMHGDNLLAVCANQGRVDVIQIHPYTADVPQVLSSSVLGDRYQELEHCTALSDGTLVYTTICGELFSVSPDGIQEKQNILLGNGSMAAALSADDQDMVYVMERGSGVLYGMDILGRTVDRVYSPSTVLDSSGELLFSQVRQTKAVSGGGFCAQSTDPAQPFWVRFDGEHVTRIDSLSRGWGNREIVLTAAVFVGSLLVMLLVTGSFTLLGRRSMLAKRIILHFMPVFLLVGAVLCGGCIYGVIHQRTAAQKAGLSAAAKAAADYAQREQISALPFAQLNEIDRSELMQSLQDAQAYAAELSAVENLGLIFYDLEQGSYYQVYATDPRDAAETAVYLAPIVQEYSEETVNDIAAAAKDGATVSFHKRGSSYLGYIQPLFGANGQTLGLMEARMEQRSWLEEENSILISVLGVGAFSILLLLVWLLLVLLRAFRPLMELGRCIREISGGNWDVKTHITSDDELAEIGLSFNQMTGKLNQYISNMVMLNNEYIRFTPRELFQLLGKNKVTDLHLRDKNVREMSLLYVTFDLKEGKLDSEAYFTLMNEHFDKIFDVVDMNRGVIERFDGSGMLVLFPWQVRDALNTAISLKELMSSQENAVELRMLISLDEMLVGVAGNQKRQTITAISNTIRDIYAFNSLMDEMGTRHVVTEDAVAKTDDFYFNYRKIGAGDSGRTNLYEFLDGMDPYEKKLNLATKPKFEQGIETYQEGNFVQARKYFADVLQINQNDTVAMYYLMLCDQQMNQKYNGM